MTRYDLPLAAFSKRGVSSFKKKSLTESLADERHGEGASDDVPDVEGPGVEVPDVEGPDVEGPGVEGPGIEGPGVEVPGVEGPGVEGPDVEVPGVEVHCTNSFARSVGSNNKFFIKIRYS